MLDKLSDHFIDGMAVNSVEMTEFDRSLYDFLLVRHCKDSSILYHFRVTGR